MRGGGWVGRGSEGQRKSNKNNDAGSVPPPICFFRSASPILLLLPLTLAVHPAPPSSPPKPASSDPAADPSCPAPNPQSEREVRSGQWECSAMIGFVINSVIVTGSGASGPLTLIHPSPPLLSTHTPALPLQSPPPSLPVHLWLPAANPWRPSPAVPAAAPPEPAEVNGRGGRGRRQGGNSSCPSSACRGRGEMERKAGQRHRWRND